MARRRTLLETAYVVAVGVAATVGFATGRTSVILLAAALALPAAVVAMPAYYVGHGLLALVPGAKPDSASGSETCTPDGTCRSSSTGDAAGWFLLTADVLGILALTGAALLNVVLLEHHVAGRRTSKSR